MSGSAVAGIIRYDSGNVYRVKGWLAFGRRKKSSVHEHPAYIERLGPDGWHTLEEFNSVGDDGNLLQVVGVIQRGRELIEGVYEQEDATPENTRRKPFNPM